MKLTPAQLDLLTRAAGGAVYVYRDPARVGGGVTLATLNTLIREGLVHMGDREGIKGRPVQATASGVARLAADLPGEAL